MVGHQHIEGYLNVIVIGNSIVRYSQTTLILVDVTNLL